jgi:hypothetical protein
MKFMCAAFFASGRPTRPSTVPLITRAPGLSLRSVAFFELSPISGVKMWP